VQIGHLPRASSGEWARERERMHGLTEACAACSQGAWAERIHALLACPELELRFCGVPAGRMSQTHEWGVLLLSLRLYLALQTTRVDREPVVRGVRASQSRKGWQGDRQSND
jgi:hypothetical protein